MRIKVEYKNENGEWAVVREHGCCFWETEAEDIALRYAQHTLAERIQRRSFGSADKALAYYATDYPYCKDDLVAPHMSVEDAYYTVRGYEWRTTVLGDNLES